MQCNGRSKHSSYLPFHSSVSDDTAVLVNHLMYVAEQCVYSFTRLFPIMYVDCGSLQL